MDILNCLEALRVLLTGATISLENFLSLKNIF